MAHVITCLLALFFSLNSLATERNAVTGVVSPQYVDQQFGQAYGVGLHNPFNPPSQMIMNQRALWEKTTCCQNAATLFAVYMVTDVAAGLAATAENPPQAIVNQLQDWSHLGSGVSQGTFNGALADVRRVSSLILVAAPIKGACCSRTGVTADQTALAEARVAARAAAQQAAQGGGSFRLSDTAGGNGLPRTLGTVNQYANQGGIGLEGITVRIIDDPQLEGRGLFGYTHPSGTEIHLYPDAFECEQSLVQTLGHERTHAYQFQTFGPTVNANTTSAQLFERAAKQSESSFYQYFLSHGGGQ